MKVFSLCLPGCKVCTKSRGLNWNLTLYARAWASK
jgi:hypothetical protein